MDFREKCPEIAGTELWETLKEKSGEDSEFLTATGEICSHGVTVSKDIIRFFPTFTLHDATHIGNVCAWMARLLGEQRQNLTKQEAALLLMSACCHDIGMSVSKEQESELLNGSTDTIKWTSYFKAHHRDELAFLRAGNAAGLDGIGKLTPEILRNYVRANHHDRIAEQLPRDWPDALRRQGITRQTLIDLCRSHGERFEKLRASADTRFDFRLCAALLRLADLLDFDASRAPDALLRHLGLRAPTTLEERISAAEWSKNRAGVFQMGTDSTLFFNAGFNNLQQEKEVQVYLDYVQGELRNCIHELHQHSSRWKELPLPYTISTERADRRGYRSGDFRLTMDQDKVIRLLTGKNLYADAGVFVRELLQNAIDAVLYRATIDPRFEVEDGHIVIRTWIDRNGDSWFRIEDNGIGMDEHTIQNYFLKVGRSYYTSDEFQLDKLHYGKKTANGREDYTPISRFGIGFLSCFMSDPDYNQVQVSTRRFTQDPMRPNPGIRLDVTSLNGYYYLAVEGEQETWEETFSPMAHPDDADPYYRSEPGTTICVRANLYRMGGYRSFREIVDKYLCFPRFKVEYIGAEGRKVYPTQQELMDAVHAMNPDGSGHEPKKYEHPLPDDIFEELKAKTLDTTWHEKPSIILQYYPLDWYSDSGNISGFGVKATLKANTSIEPFLIDGQEYYPNSKNQMGGSLLNTNFGFLHTDYRFVYQYSFSNEMSKKIECVSLEDLLRKQRMDAGSFVSIPKTILASWIRKDGCSAFYAQDVQSFMDFPYISAYNNVLVGIFERFTSPIRSNDSLLCARVLFTGQYAPEIAMERNEISSLPLEAALELSVIAHETELFTSLLIEWNQATTRALREILQKHPVWEKYVKINGVKGDLLSLPEIRGIFSKNAHAEIPFTIDRDAYSALCLTAICREYAVRTDTTGKSRSFTFTITNAPPDDTTIDFPSRMFFPPVEENAPLFARVLKYGSQYNQEHRFSQWLIQNQPELEKHATGLYNDMLKAMWEYNGKDGLIADINAILTQLRGYRNNYFGVTDELFLTDADIVEIIEEEDE